MKIYYLAIISIIIPGFLFSFSGHCPEEKIMFSKEKGCENDGYVEFCLPSEGFSNLLNELLLIDERISCSPKYTGRIKCKKGKEYLCFFPVIEDQDCLNKYGEMRDEAWKKVCEIASKSFVNKIAPTFF